MSAEFSEIIIDKLDILSQTFGNIDKKLSSMEQQIYSLQLTQNSLDNEFREIKSSLCTKKELDRLECMLNGTMDILETTYRNLEKTDQAVIDKLDDIRQELSTLNRKICIQDYEIVNLKKAL